MFLLRFLLFLQTSAVSRIRYIQNAGLASILILPLPSLAQMNGIVKLPNRLRFTEYTHCLLLMICQDGLPCTGAKRERLIENARIRDLA